MSNTEFEANLRDAGDEAAQGTIVGGGGGARGFGNRGGPDQRGPQAKVGDGPGGTRSND